MGCQAFIGYGVFVGELVAPLLIILGIFTAGGVSVFIYPCWRPYLLIDPARR
ncbi:Uncharacterised protein [Serratia fonticola]|uniref:Uncharacterized protein n=1 Tax=Serratia fonticola TaxID=47917 RepID=A0A4U9V8N8_SERFO|nr:Uncharacterised protein [Serratia fonticola]